MKKKIFLLQPILIMVFTTLAFKAPANNFKINEEYGDSVKVSNPSIVLYPNPFQSEFYIDRKNSDFNHAIVKDILGKVVLSLSLNEQVSIVNESHPLFYKMTPGVYFLFLTSDRKESTIIKFVKSR